MAVSANNLWTSQRILIIEHSLDKNIEHYKGVFVWFPSLVGVIESKID